MTRGPEIEQKASDHDDNDKDNNEDDDNDMVMMVMIAITMQLNIEHYPFWQPRQNGEAFKKRYTPLSRTR